MTDTSFRIPARYSTKVKWKMIKINEVNAKLLCPGEEAVGGAESFGRGGVGEEISIRHTCYRKGQHV